MKTGAAALSCLFLLTVTALFPAISMAAGIPAGFPAESIWLSKTSPIAGETIDIFTVIYNESTKKITGSVVFSVDDTKVGSGQFNLDAGKSEILSAKWSAAAGTHTISATIEGASDASLNQTVTLSHGTSGSRTVTVAAPPPPSQAAQTATAVSNVVSAVVASSTPLIASTVQAVYGATESLRQQGVAYFENQLAQNGQPTGNSAQASNTRSAILGTSTRGSGNIGAAGPAASPWWKSAVHMFDTAALTVLRSAVFFYPLLILLILATFYVLARRVRRNSNS